MDENKLSIALSQLNPEQQEAVEHMTGGWRTPEGGVRLTVVDGPPGTGKTHVSATAAGQWIRNHRSQVILLTPTHQAAERVQDALLKVGFELREAVCLAPGRPEQPKPGLITFDRIDRLPPHLLRQLRQARIFITTWQGCQRALQAASSNFLLLFDEVSQIPFSAFVSLLPRIRRQNTNPAGYALIGDLHQLPVITTQDILATNAALGILSRHPECTPHHLVLQYRMNKAICDVVNVVRRVAFGGTPLQPASDAIGQRTLDQITGYYQRRSQFDDILNPYVPVVFVDTRRFATEREWREDAIGTSWVYRPEALLSICLAHAIQQTYRVPPVILSPYRAQEAMIRSCGYHNARTIFKAQGQEWDCAILTLGRTIGYTILDEIYQHTYVGLSRAKAKLIVLFNADFFRQFHLFAALLDAIPTISGVHLVEAEPAWGEE